MTGITPRSPNDHDLVLPFNLIQVAALGTVRDTVVVAPFLNRTLEAAWDGIEGDTYNVRIPAELVAQDFDYDEGIKLQGLKETSIPVTIGGLIDVSVPLSTKQARNFSDLQGRVIEPMARALALKVEEKVLAQIAAVTQTTAAPNGASPTDEMAYALEVLSITAPNERLVGLVSPRRATKLLTDPDLKNADKSGNGGAALRQAEIGNLYTVDTYRVNKLGVSGKSFVMSRDAFGLVCIAPEAPAGLDRSQYRIFTDQATGFAFRLMFTWDPVHKTSILSMDCFAEAFKIDLRKAVVFTDPTVADLRAGVSGGLARDGFGGNAPIDLTGGTIDLEAEAGSLDFTGSRFTEGSDAGSGGSGSGNTAGNATPTQVG